MAARLVVVSGLPAAGKSTIARRLGDDLGLPVLRRDGLRDAVFGAFESMDATTGTVVGEALTRLVAHLLDELVDAGVGAVADLNFNLPVHAVAVREVVRRPGVVACEIHVRGDRAVLRDRFVQRAAPPLTPEIEPYYRQVVDTPAWTVLDDDERILRVDSTDLDAFQTRQPEIVAWVRARTSDAGSSPLRRTGR